MKKSSETETDPAKREVMASMRAMGGASWRRRLISASIWSGVPQASISTPRGSVRTQPVRPSALANRQTVGRNPTPWTIPLTRMR